MSKKYIIKQIVEADFGCEGRPDGYVPMVRVYLGDENGVESIVEMEDAKMYERQLDEGMEVIIGNDGTLMNTLEKMEGLFRLHCWFLLPNRSAFSRQRLSRFPSAC